MFLSSGDWTVLVAVRIERAIAVPIDCSLKVCELAAYILRPNRIMSPSILEREHARLYETLCSNADSRSARFIFRENRV